MKELAKDLAYKITKMAKDLQVEKKSKPWVPWSSVTLKIHRLQCQEKNKAKHFLTGDPAPL